MECSFYNQQHIMSRNTILMLKQTPTLHSILPAIIILILHLLIQNTSALTPLDLLITNTPDFYYSHRCQLTLSFVSTAYQQYNPQGSQIFILSILQAKYGTRFLTGYQPPLIHNSNSQLIRQSMVDLCGRGNSSASYYCFTILCHSNLYPTVKIPYNTTHSMYKITLNNIVCPTQDADAGGYHLRLQVDVPINQISTDVRMSGVWNYTFVGLRYRVVDFVMVNPGYQGDGVGEELRDVTVQQRNMLVKYPSNLSFTMSISNQSQLLNWQSLHIHFDQPLTAFTLSPSTCKLTTIPSISTSPTSITPQCSYSTIKNTLTFTNPNYTISSFMYNQDFNLYGLYSLGMQVSKVVLGIQGVFGGVGDVGFWYEVVAVTDKGVDDMGNVVNASSTTAVLYQSKKNKQTIYGLNLTQYLKLEPKYRMPCSYQSNSTNPAPTSSTSSIFTALTTSSSVPFVFTLLLLLLALLLAGLRKQMYQIEKYLFFIIVLSDLIVKIVVIGVIDQLVGSGIDQENNKEVSYMLSVFVVVQYFALGTPFFLTYCVYLYSNRKYVAKGGHHDERLSRRVLGFVVLAMLFNYKFYCVALFSNKVKATLNNNNTDNSASSGRRFRNDQLYTKYCLHLGVQVLLILLQIFYLVSNCNFLPITIVYCVHQGVLLLLMAIAGKCVYRMLKLKKIKKKISKICHKNKDIRLDIMNQENNLDKLQVQQVNNLEIISKKSGRSQPRDNLHTNRPLNENYPI